MNGQSSKCPVCQEVVADRRLSATMTTSLGMDTFDFKCLRCGRYAATREFLQDNAPADSPTKIPDPLRPFLSAATREASERGDKIHLTTKNWRDLAEHNERASVTARVDKLLHAIARKSRYPGRSVDLSFENDYPLAGASNGGELTYYLAHLQGERLLVQNGAGNLGGTYLLTVAGWHPLNRAWRLEAYRADASSRCRLMHRSMTPTR